MQLIKYQHIAFWDAASYIQLPNAVAHKYPLVKLQEIITLRKDFIKIHDEVEYKRCKVQLYAKGIELRDIVKGIEIKTKKQQECRANEFLVAEIDAKFGGYGVVPESLEGAIVSNHYFLYEINHAKLLPEFLGLYIKTAEFHRQIQAVGSTNYAAIRSYQVLEYQIPLPPLSVQQQLVSDYRAHMTQAADAEAKANDLEKGIETYLLTELGIEFPKTTPRSKGLQFINYKDISRWSVEYLLNREKFEANYKTKFPTVKLGVLCKGISGGTPLKQNTLFWNGNIPWVSPKDMKSDRITETQDYITDEAIKTSSVPLIEPNSLLFVVRSGILQHTVPVAINDVSVSINQDLRAFRLVDNEITTIEWLFTFFKYAQIITLKVVKSSTTVQSIDYKRLENLEIPLPPLSVQCDIIAYINEQKAEIKQFRTEAERLRTEAKTAFEQEIFEQ